MANYTSRYTGAQLDSAIEIAHNHTNKSILDSIPNQGATGMVLTKTTTGTTWAQAPGSGSGSALNVQGGVVNAGTVQDGKTADITITFPTAYAGVPHVNVCIDSDVNSGDFGRCSCAVITDSVTKTGMKVRFFNGSYNDRAPKIRWIAIGI